jgi:hypothetical protein
MWEEEEEEEEQTKIYISHLVKLCNLFGEFVLDRGRVVLLLLLVVTICSVAAVTVQWCAKTRYGYRLDVRVRRAAVALASRKRSTRATL